MDIGASALTPGLGQVSMPPINKHGSITQVKNGFVFYASGETFVAYTFEELVAHLNDYFVLTQAGAVV